MNSKIYLSRLYAAAVLIAFALIFSPATGADTLESLIFESRWPDASSGNLASDSSGETLFFASGNILTILDAATFNERSRLTLDTKKGITGIAFSPVTNTVFAACGGSGLKLVDVSNPDEPKLTGELKLDPDKNTVTGTALAYLDNRVYLADIFSGLRVIDVSNPALPGQIGVFEQISEFADPDNPDRSYSGGHIKVLVRVINAIKYAFVLDQYYGLRVFDVSADAAIELLDQYDMRAQEYYGQLSPVTDIEADDNYLYITDSSHGITILSIFSDPDSPSRITISKTGQIETPGSASGIALSGNTIHVADGNSGLFAADVSNRENPVQTGSYAANGAYLTSFMAGYTLMADCTDGLVRLEQSGAEGFVKTMSYVSPGNFSAVTTDGSHIFLLDKGGPEEGLRILEPSDNDGYALQSFIKTPGNASNIAIFESRAYIADGASGICVVDIEDTGHPFIEDTFEPGGFAVDIFIDSTSDGTATAYISDSQTGLIVADIDDTGKLTRTGGIHIENARASALYAPLDETGENTKKYLLVVNISGLSIVDLTDESDPVLVSFTPTRGDALDIKLKDNYAVIAAGTEGVLLMDLSDPINPVIAAAYDTDGSARAVDVSGSYIHTADGSHGLQVIGIVDTDPVELTLITSYDTPGYSSDALIGGNEDDRNTYIADGIGGFLSFSHSDRLSDGIDAKPFTDSPDDSGWDRADSAHCFISTLF